MHSNLRDQQLKIIMYMHRYPYINLRVTKTQKSIIDIDKKKRKESKHNNKDSHQITREESKRRRTKNYKNNPKHLTKWQ